jgi:hypothetical protein
MPSIFYIYVLILLACNFLLMMCLGNIGLLCTIEFISNLTSLCKLPIASLVLIHEFGHGAYHIGVTETHCTCKCCKSKDTFVLQADVMRQQCMWDSPCFILLWEW